MEGTLVMATAQEKQDIARLKDDVGDLKTDVAVMKTDMRYIKDTSREMKAYLDENRSGITLASLLNSKVVGTVLAGMVAAGIYFAAKGGGL